MKIIPTLGPEAYNDVNITYIERYSDLEGSNLAVRTTRRAPRRTAPAVKAATTEMRVHAQESLRECYHQVVGR